MNKLTRQELDDRLLDYLYDELEPSERSAFERALLEHPEIAAEVEAHRATRKAYAVLPREVAPPGLLANVLREAEVEAKRRAAGAEQVSWWEKVRRVLFQPTFAMAAAVLLVAGVSYVSITKNRLPGMEPAHDSQHIPPVAMTAPSPVVAEGQGEERARGAAIAEAPGQELPAALATAAAPEVAQPERESKTDPAALDKSALGKGDLGKAPPRPAVAPEATKTKYVDAPAPKVAAEVADNKGARQGTIGGDSGLADGDGAADTLGGVEDDFSRRPSNTGNVAPRAPAEAWVAPTTPAPDDARKKSDAAEEATTFEKVAESPKREPPAKPVDSPAKAPATKDAAPSGPPPVEAERDVVDVLVTRNSRDEEAKREETNTKPATLTPPAPNAETLWSTYRKQDSAGAYADALRSIEALAKLEGESTRVKEARAQLKSKLATPKPATTDKVPPDPPVQAPK